MIFAKDVSLSLIHIYVYLYGKTIALIMRSELLKLLVKMEMIRLEFFQLNVCEHKNAINLYSVCVFGVLF